jgi:hypothetical protein
MEEIKLPCLIRHTHPYGFRTGEWAIARRIVESRGRACYLIEFPKDHVTDVWVVNDPQEPYEFKHILAPDK